MVRCRSGGCKRTPKREARGRQGFQRWSSRGRRDCPSVLASGSPEGAMCPPEFHNPGFSVWQGESRGAPPLWQGVHISRVSPPKRESRERHSPSTYQYFFIPPSPYSIKEGGQRDGPSPNASAAKQSGGWQAGVQRATALWQGSGGGVHMSLPDSPYLSLRAPRSNSL